MATSAQLSQLAKNIPGLVASATTQAQNATQLQLGQQVQAAPQGTLPTQQAAQQLAAQQAQQAAQIQLGGLQQSGQQLQQLGQLGLQAQQASTQTEVQNKQLAAQTRLADKEIQQRAVLTTAELASRKKITNAEIQSQQRVQSLGIEQDNKLLFMTLKQRQDLQRIGGDVKAQLLDSRLQFERDELGRKFTNERQLADWRISNLKTQQEFDSEMQQMTFTYGRQAQMLDQGYRVIMRELEQGFSREQQGLDFKQKKELLAMKDAAEKAIRDKANHIANNTAMWQGIGTIAGAAVGAYFGGPTGAAVGAGVGAGAGTAISGTQGGY